MAEYQYGGKDTRTFQKLHGFKKIVDASFFLGRLLQALVKKEQDGTWDKNYWVKEEQTEYLIDIETDTEFPEFLCSSKGEPNDRRGRTNR